MKKEIKKGKWLLTHERYIDYRGIETDSFDLFDTKKRIHTPFFGNIKIVRKSSYFDNKLPNYTKHDYEVMIDEQISLQKKTSIAHATLDCL